MDNILDNKFYFPDNFSPDALAKKVAGNLRQRRLFLDLTQKALAKKSGVSLGSLKRFESLGEISLKNLLLLAISLQATEEFLRLFEQPNYQSVDDVIRAKYVKIRQRGRKND